MLDLHDLEEFFWEEMHRHENADKKTNHEQNKKFSQWWYMLKERRREIENRELDDYNFQLNINWNVWKDEKLTDKAKLDGLKFELISIKNQLRVINEMEHFIEKKKEFIEHEKGLIDKKIRAEQEEKSEQEAQLILELKEKERRIALDLSTLYKWHEILNKVGEVVGYWCETIQHQAFIYLFETDRKVNKWGVRYTCEPNVYDFSWGKDTHRWSYDRYYREGNNAELPSRFSYGVDKYFPDKEKAQAVFNKAFQELKKQVMQICIEEGIIREQIKKDKEEQNAPEIELNNLILCQHEVFDKER